MFASTMGKGFHITFGNGWTASVQFGSGNYCENHFSNIGPNFDDRTSPDAEIAAWDANDNWHRFEKTDDTVLGWQSPDQVLAFLNMVAALPATKTTSI